MKSSTLNTMALSAMYEHYLNYMINDVGQLDKVTEQKADIVED